MEKGLSYFDLAENDYQFLLKDKKRRPCRQYYVFCRTEHLREISETYDRYLCAGL